MLSFWSELAPILREIAHAGDGIRSCQLWSARRVGAGGVTNARRRAILFLPKRCRRSMHDENKKPVQESDSPATISDAEEIRATMEQTREALEASGAEIERSKRLLRESEDLLDLPVSSEPADSDQ